MWSAGSPVSRSYSVPEFEYSLVKSGVPSGRTGNCSTVSTVARNAGFAVVGEYPVGEYEITRARARRSDTTAPSTLVRLPRTGLDSWALGLPDVLW